MALKQTLNKHLKTTVFLIITTIFTLFPLQVPNVAAQTQEELEAQLRQIEQQIAELENQLKSATTEKNTIAGKVKQLKTEHSKISLEVQSTNVLIDDLETKIVETTGSIEESEQRIELLKSQISRTLLEVYQRDTSSFVAALASAEGLSGFFEEVDNFTSLSEELGTTLSEVKDLKLALEEQEVALGHQQQSAEGLLVLRASQQKDLNNRLLEQNALLNDSLSKESQVTVVLNHNKRVASEIRSQIYELLGIKTEVTFGQAVDIANTVSAATGVRAAFLLAVLTQESNLGKNVGTCNREGDPPNKSWKEIMKPERDQEPFKVITAELGLDIDTTPVSCPIFRNGVRNGWGGAMGPAQFIPSTWMGYKDKVAAITGKPANPWDIVDAFYAAGIKLAAGGATKNGEKGEWDAAMRYYSGSTNPRNRFYGDSVIAIARKYQNDINTLLE